VELARGSVRFSLGRENTDAEIDACWKPSLASSADCGPCRRFGAAKLSALSHKAEGEQVQRNAAGSLRVSLKSSLFYPPRMEAWGLTGQHDRSLA